MQSERRDERRRRDSDQFLRSTEWTPPPPPPPPSSDKLSWRVKSIKLTPRKRGWWIGRRPPVQDAAAQTGRKAIVRKIRAWWCSVVGRRLNAAVRGGVNPIETSTTTTTTTTSSCRSSGNCTARLYVNVRWRHCAVCVGYGLRARQSLQDRTQRWLTVRVCARRNDLCTSSSLQAARSYNLLLCASRT